MLSPISTRRDILSVLSGLGVSFLLPGLDLRATQRRGAERPRSLITLWMAGGPSQLESWDPHPGTKIGGPTLAIKTNVSGLSIAEHYPLMAERMSEVCLIRSLVSKEGDHERATYLLKTGFRPDQTIVHPSLGAILAHRYEEEHQTDLDIPRYISLSPNQWPGRGGFLGDQFDAFKIYNPNDTLQNMQTRVTESDRKTRRLETLNVVEDAFSARRKHSEKTLHRDTIQRALKMMTTEQLQAFKIAEEPAAVRKAYGDTPFGQGCLVARRLVEQGVRAIEVTLDGFDTHADNFTGQRNRAATVDPAFASLLNDLKERHLLESTVVLCIGEFGRTPNVNPLSGRDHWPTGFSAVVAGGGFKQGLVVGQTDPTGAKKDPQDPVEVQDLYATILDTFHVDYKRERITPIGRPMPFSKGTKLDRLLG